MYAGVQLELNPGQFEQYGVKERDSCENGRR